MNGKTVEASKERLRRAKDAIDKMRDSGTTEIWQHYIDGWWTFVMAVNGIFSKLEQGAKVDPKSVDWFARVKGVRSSDESLNYIRHARNSEEHQAEDSTYGELGFQPAPGIKFEPSSNFGQKPMRITFRDDYAGPLGKFTSITNYLKPVRDRNGKIFSPPKQHLGNVFQDESPLGVATAVLPYIERIVAEADALTR